MSPEATLTSDLAASDPALTPVMRQYFAAKQQHPDCLMFCRIGDFYELFYEDAILVARLLQLTLTARDREKKQPMCGVPYHAAEVYLQKLLRMGYKIALCEQMEDPKTTKTIVRREVTRVLTPGTSADPALGPSETCWLATLALTGSGPLTKAGLALLDLSTGDFRATEFTGPQALTEATDELGRIRPVELLYAAEVLGPTTLLEEKTDPTFEHIRTKTPLDAYVFTPDYALPLLRTHFRLHSLDGIGLAAHEPAAIAAGATLHYLRATKQGALEHIDTVRFYERSTSLELDAVSVRNLELVDPLFSGETAQTTLFHTLDACCTPMGKRLLRATLLRPSSSLREIESRHEAVAEATADLRRRETLRRAMDTIHDLERLLGRVAMDSAGPREVLSLASTLAALPTLRAATNAFASPRWQHLATTLDPLEDLHELITQSIAEDAPVSLADGNVIRKGVDEELDDLRTLSHSGRQALVAIEERERQRTGISSLKVRFNSVFGYYIEITKSNARAVPPDYERKQTLVNAERFTTPELKEYEAKILTAQERSLEIERKLFTELRRQLLASAPRMRETARHLAEIDLLANFSHLAALRGWTRPTLDDTTTLEFLNARHPVVERRMEESGQGRFVPNTLYLNASNTAAAETSSSPTPLSSSPTPSSSSPAPLLSTAAPSSSSPALLLSSRSEAEGSAVAPLLSSRSEAEGSAVAPLLSSRSEAEGSAVAPLLSSRSEAEGSAVAPLLSSRSEAEGSAVALTPNQGPSVALITGPNMGGKSTYLRQSALLVIMAQCGSFVPAERMTLGLVDRIYTRIGASDNVARGRSTFMVEMTETAAILNTATARSLVLLDEMGRGTATYDGLSLAWATVEHLHNRIGARTLFATHYHELTLLAEKLPRLQNLRVTARETNTGIVFLHTVEPGPASKSYGIEVARLAGLPQAVITRAREVLKLHERAESQQIRDSSPTPPPLQMTMFTPLSQRIVDRLAAIDLDATTPREALNLLADLQRELEA